MGANGANAHQFKSLVDPAVGPLEANSPHRSRGGEPD
jgi:hypothetical protein